MVPISSDLFSFTTVHSTNSDLINSDEVIELMPDMEFNFIELTLIEGSSRASQQFSKLNNIYTIL